ncbi:hypothetical protein TNCV_3963611 [Trichonephila clavipes]|nr:hypothetical protein TNCV_3963611 [Trichonephila clavipes]
MSPDYIDMDDKAWGHTELILLMNSLKKRIFAVWIDSRDPNSVACLRDDLGKVISRRSSSKDPPEIKTPAFDKMGKLPQMLTETFINSQFTVVTRHARQSEHSDFIIAL